jgi:hypothetical protein
MPPMPEVGFCRELNLSEPVAGSATAQVVRWVLLEDPGPWGAQTPRDSGLPAPVVAWLTALDAQPGVRTQLIRRPGCASMVSRPGQGTRKLIIAEAPADPSGRRLIELELPLAELPSLDLDALVAAAPPQPKLAELWLVCTHGTRDRCCAKWGMPVFEALRQRDPTRVWQCSHLGGHRFAPTFLTLPDGLMWGRFDLAKLDDLIAALAHGRLAALDHLRGRCCYSRPVQVAEIAVRAELGLDDDEALTWIDATPTLTSEGATQVRFRGPSGELRVIEIEAAPLDFEAPPSCGDPPERRVGLRLRKN